MILLISFILFLLGAWLTKNAAKSFWWAVGWYIILKLSMDPPAS